MQDGASVHTAHIIWRLLAEMGIEVMDWPPYSPDLNPIENLWALIKAKIYKIYPHLAEAADTDKTLQELIEAAQEAWEAIDFDILKKLNDTMPHWIKAVIEADRWYTKY
jgi:transposase